MWRPVLTKHALGYGPVTHLLNGVINLVVSSKDGAFL